MPKVPNLYYSALTGQENFSEGVIRANIRYGYRENYASIEKEKLTLHF